ncbi:hypothetical protein [Isoptericola jiangsuensis]|nr:hypothetical protein [Isoptericola jiangsuensis]
MSAWVQLGVAPAAWATYLVLLLARADGQPLATTPYADLVLWTLGGAGAATLVTAALLRRRQDPADTRDREIDGRAEAIGNALVVIGALAALGLALADVPTFWIANTLYLAFVLAAVLGALARIGLYRGGVPGW